MESFKNFEIRLKNYLLSHNYYANTSQGIEDIVMDIVENSLGDVGYDIDDVYFYKNYQSKVCKNIVACLSRTGPTWKLLEEKYGYAQLDATQAYYANVALFQLHLNVQTTLKDEKKVYVIKDIQVDSMFSYIQEAFHENVQRISKRHERERRLFIR